MRTINYDPNYVYSALHVHSGERWVVIGAQREIAYIAGFPTTIAPIKDLILWRKSSAMAEEIKHSRRQMFGDVAFISESTKLVTAPLIFAFDFDGTLVSHRYPEIGRPNKNVVDFLLRLREENHKIILWTCRNNADPALNGRQVLTEAVDFCREKLNIVFDAVNENIQGLGINPTPKIYYDFLVDDRNFCSGHQIHDL